MMRHALPFAAPRQKIGLLGGSFDPAHLGHVHITREALKWFGLDRIWWLVSPGNPLKIRQPAPLATRLEQARTLMQHPKVLVTDIEAHLGTRYTFETIAALMRLYPHTHFTWLMGADNLTQFHRWDRWESIMEALPIGVLARPGERISARTSKAAQIYAGHRLRKAQVRQLPTRAAPAWAFINIPMRAESSTLIRSQKSFPLGRGISKTSRILV